jgi:aquaporin TIP
MGALLAECIGTFALMFLGGGSIVVSQGLGQAGLQTLIGIALAHGLTIAAFGSAFGHISGGHFNPAVTVGFLATGRIDAAKAIQYIIAQVLGATLAAFILTIAMPSDWIVASKLGTPLLAPNVTVVGGFILEFVTTFFLMMVIFGTAVDPRGPKMAALFIGFTVAIDILAIGPLTGAAMNPARSIGPALVSGNLADFWLYWLAPISGAVAAAFAYQTVMLKEE